MIKEICLVLAFLISVEKCVLTVSTVEQDVPVMKYRSESVQPLAALIEVGQTYHIPLAILIGEKGGKLCTAPSPYDIKSRSTVSLISEIADKAGYIATEKDGVIVVRNPQLTAHDYTVLNHVFDKVSPGRTTMHGLGLVLTGWVEMHINGSSGFGVDIIEPVDSKMLMLGPFEDKTTEEIANQIVSQNGKGVWIYQSADNPNRPKRYSADIEIHSYDDEADKAALKGSQCRTL